MTSRNLTSNFFEFRNHATRDRSFHADDKSINDRTALLHNEDEEVVQYEKYASPLWMESQRRLQLQLEGVRSRMKKLQLLHDKRIRRPDFDENINEEKEIESITKDITSMLNDCYTSIQRLSSQAKNSQQNTYDQRLSFNAVQASATALQDLTIKFRSCQSAYLLKLKSRKDNFSSIMPDPESYMHSNSYSDRNDLNENLDPMSMISDPQLQLQSQNSDFLGQRDKEIQDVLKSMDEVNDLFRDVAVIISDQRTRLDQIECNIEDTVVQLEQGNKQLEKAVEHQKRSLKFKLILIGIGFFVLLFVILVGVIFR